MSTTAVTALYRSQSYSDRVAAEVRAAAARRGLMQKDLAQALGYVPSQITKRMKGQIPFTLDELDTLARLFEMQPSELLPPRSRLPHLDSNQEPAGYSSLQVRGRLNRVITPSHGPLQLVPEFDEYAHSGDWWPPQVRRSTHRKFTPAWAHSRRVVA